MLLLYQTSKITLGALVPQVIMKHEKYAKLSCVFMSVCEKIMKPHMVKANPSAIKGNRSLVRSEAKPRMRSMTAPVTFGATV